MGVLVSVAALAVPFLLALVPIIWLVVALIALHLPAWKAAVGSFAIACVLALGYWKLPALHVATASAEGFLMALWPIVLVIIAAVFTYNLCVHTGAMDVISTMITSLSADRRVLALLVAWCFGGFMEGMSGFGTAVAIPAGMLAALGFSPVRSVLICLVANGVPTCFGSVGVPTVSLAGLTGLDPARLAFTEMLQLAPFFMVVPFIIVCIAGEPEGGARLSVGERLRGVAGIAQAAGVAYALPALVVAAVMGPELTVVVGSLASLGATALLARRVTDLDERFAMVPAGAPEGVSRAEVPAPSAVDALRAWSCFILIFVLLLMTSKLVAPVNAWLAQFSSRVTIYAGPNPSVVSFTWVNTPGVWIFIAAFVGGVIQGARLPEMLRVLAATARQMAPTAATMLAVLGCAKVMGYAGMIGAISSFLIALTGSMFPLVAPVIGAIGAFVTGSGTSSGLLFGSVQLQAAEALGMDPHWMCALNSLGVGAGKMISPQTLAIGMAAVQITGVEGKLLSRVMPVAVGFMLAMAAIGLGGALLL